MISPENDVGSSSRPMHDFPQSSLAELRDCVAAIAKEVASMAGWRARRAREAAVSAAEAGAEEWRGAIRRQPVITMAAAAVAGALLAVVVMPRSGARSSRRDRSRSNITRADLYEIADKLQRSLSRTAGGAAAPITPAFERMLDALSRTDASSIDSILDKVGGWLQKVQEKARQKL